MPGCRPSKTTKTCKHTQSHDLKSPTDQQFMYEIISNHWVSLWRRLCIFDKPEKYKNDLRRGLAKYSKKTNLKISRWVNPQGCRLESLKRNGGGVNGQSLTSGRGPIGGDMLLCWGWNWFSYLHTVSVSTSSPSSSSLFCSDSCLLHKLWRETIFGAVKRGGLCVCV